MYPTADIELDPRLPANAEFWVPEPDEIDDYEGFGMFQDVWPITDLIAARIEPVQLRFHRVQLRIRSVVRYREQRLVDHRESLLVLGGETASTRPGC